MHVAAIRLRFWQSFCASLRSRPSLFLHFDYRTLSILTDLEVEKYMHRANFSLE